MVLLHLDAFIGQNLTFSHQISVQLKISEHFRAHFFVFRAQFLTKRRHFRPDPFLSCAERWQDLRAVRDSRGPCSERGPFLARSSRGVSSDGGLRGISDAWRAYLAKASPFSDAWRANLAANWRFSRPRPLSGCMERKTCHGLPPGNAPRRNLATARPLGTHRARILPLPVRPRAHQGAILPPSSAQKRISRAFCHRRAPGNASRHNLATTGRPRRTPRAPMCHGSRSAHAPWLRAPPPFAYATRHPDAAGLRVLQAVRVLAVAQPADCRVAAERVVNIAKLVSVPQRRSARHHAPQRRNAVRCNITTPCATTSCAVRGALVAAEKVSCGLRVSMR